MQPLDRSHNHRPDPQRVDEHRGVSRLDSGRDRAHRRRQEHGRHAWTSCAAPAGAHDRARVRRVADGRARNRGSRRANALAAVHGRRRPFAPDYFAELASSLSDAGRSVAMLFGPKLSADDYAGPLPAARGGAAHPRARLRIPAATGSNMLVRADAFAAVGGFDTALTCNEDSELGWRIARAGFAWRYDPRLVAFATDHRRLRRGAMKKTLHTVFRCSSLYLGVIPRRWRGHDWGYWREPRQLPE